MEERSIHISLDKKHIVNDVMIQCNIIARGLQKNPETEELAAEIMTPDDKETKPIVARSISEGFAEVKRICQRYLSKGRDTDDNRLEKINESGDPMGEFGKLELILSMPATFNTGMTNTVQTNAHRMMVNYVMHSLLHDQLAEKAAEYMQLYLAAQEGLRSALFARIPCTRRSAPDWA